MTSWMGLALGGCRLDGVERDILRELEIAGVDCADVGTGIDFCSLIDDKKDFVGVVVGAICVARDLTRLSFRRATALSFAKQISIEEQTVERDICWSKMVFT